MSTESVSTRISKRTSDQIDQVTGEVKRLTGCESRQAVINEMCTTPRHSLCPNAVEKLCIVRTVLKDLCASEDGVDGHRIANALDLVDYVLGR